ncbi:hypothetical protein ACOME3_002659 [Neoechinorhynchus agilis]
MRFLILAKNLAHTVLHIFFVSSTDLFGMMNIPNEVKCKCCDEIASVPCIVYPCSHFFCQQCLLNYVKLKGEFCPCGISISPLKDHVRRDFKAERFIKEGGQQVEALANPWGCRANESEQINPHSQVFIMIKVYWQKEMIYQSYLQCCASLPIKSFRGFLHAKLICHPYFRIVISHNNFMIFDGQGNLSDILQAFEMVDNHPVYTIDIKIEEISIIDSIDSRYSGYIPENILILDRLVSEIEPNRLHRKDQSQIINEDEDNGNALNCRVFSADKQFSKITRQILKHEQKYGSSFCKNKYKSVNKTLASIVGTEERDSV